METINAIKNRRSIRAYKKDEIKKELIEEILNAGRLAPSAKNRQPWYFVIVKDEIKNKIADLMIADKTNSDPDERKKLGTKSSVNPTANTIKQAPVLILIFREKNDNWIIGDTLSIGACVENMCLRATELGIGSLWIRDTTYVSKEIASLLGHEEMELSCALTLGIANEQPNERPRKKLEDIMEWYN